MEAFHWIACAPLAQQEINQQNPYNLGCNQLFILLSFHLSIILLYYSLSFIYNISNGKCFR